MNFELEFTEQEINTIAKALSMLPYYEAVQVINKLHDQYTKAKQPQPEVKNEE